METRSDRDPGPAWDRRILIACTWCGPLFVLGLFGGWGILGGFLPAPSPADSADQVAAFYRENADLDRVGLLISMCASFLVLPFSLAVSVQMRRSEGPIPLLAILQFASGIVTTVVLIIPTLIFIVASFRPERTPELTQLLNDLSYIMIILPFPPVVGQLIPVALSILGDRGERPVFPRWIGYFNLWCAVLVLPVALLVFWQSGALSWNGAIGFWIAAAAFGTWYPVMTYGTLRAIREEASAPPPDHPPAAPPRVEALA